MFMLHGLIRILIDTRPSWHWTTSVLRMSNITWALGWRQQIRAEPDVSGDVMPSCLGHGQAELSRDRDFQVVFGRDREVCFGARWALQYACMRNGY